MRVWRVELDNGEGPYCGNELVRRGEDGESMASAHGGDPLRPAPWQDGIDPWAQCHQSYVYGTTSLDALRCWFDGWVDVLDSYDYGVSEYDVPDEHVTTGRIQLAFDPVEASLIGRHGMSVLTDAPALV